jgi:hypothetical protein
MHVGVRLYDQHLKKAVWRYPHCVFISCRLRLSRDEENASLGGRADRSRPKRPGDAKLSLLCREGLPNLAFNQLASTLPPFAASLAFEPQNSNIKAYRLQLQI